MKFATKDQNHGGTNCPMYVRGAWWYNNSYCSYANFNGKYQHGVSTDIRFVGDLLELITTQMMMRKN